MSPHIGYVFTLQINRLLRSARNDGIYFEHREKDKHSYPKVSQLLLRVNDLKTKRPEVSSVNDLKA